LFWTWNVANKIKIEATKLNGEKILKIFLDLKIGLKEKERKKKVKTKEKERERE
jgi:hypothetical protein